MNNPSVTATKPASDLQIGDQVQAESLNKHLDGVAEILFAQPYSEYGTTGMTALLSFGGTTQPRPVNVALNQTVTLASAEEVAEAKAAAERDQVADGLRSLAALVQDGSVPLNKGRMHVHESVGDIAEVAQIGEALGIPVVSSGRMRSVEWPRGHESYQPGLHVTWYAYAPKDPEPEPADEPVSEPR